jgi:L-ascorbate metabolism protein UlaG (beta-lactamase superfamily)
MTTIAVTRIINATVLIELAGGSILTDPYFDPHWYMRFDEPIGLRADQLPPLAAILGGHGVFDHWQPASLRPYPHHRVTPVYVANNKMARSARKAGMHPVEVLGWGQQRKLGADLTVTSVPGQRITGVRTNSYIISSAGASIFIGTEARDLAPIRAVATNHPIDIAILPTNGARLLGRRLVMDAPTAVSAAQLLGAHTLIPIHYAQRPVPPLLTTPSRIDDLHKNLADTPGLHIEILPPGARRQIDTERHTATDDAPRHQPPAPQWARQGLSDTRQRHIADFRTITGRGRRR